MLSNQTGKTRTLTIVAPFHNEETNVKPFYDALQHVLNSLEWQASCVFVDDGSADQTLRELRDLAQNHKNIVVISLARNFGHQAAITAGLDHADSDVVITMDSDLQHPPAVIPQMLALHDSGHDIVYAVRSKQYKEGWFKRITSRFYYYLLLQIAHTRVIPGAADFRLMSQKVVLALRKMRETHRYLRGMVPWMGFTYTTLTFEQADRFSGEPSYTWRKSLRLARQGLFSFSTMPLEVITYMGIILTCGAGLYLLVILVEAIAGKTIPGWSSLIASVLLIGGVQLISLGVIAQYVGMIFEQVKERPLYIISEVITRDQPDDPVDIPA